MTRVIFDPGIFSRPISCQTKVQNSYIILTDDRLLWKMLCTKIYSQIIFIKTNILSKYFNTGIL